MTDTKLIKRLMSDAATVVRRRRGWMARIDSSDSVDRLLVIDQVVKGFIRIPMNAEIS